MGCDDFFFLFFWLFFGSLETLSAGVAEGSGGG